MHNGYSYVNTYGVNLFTVVCLPQKTGRFPTVLFRSPYVDYAVTMDEDAAVEHVAEMQKSFIENGYAVVYQHCRGCGKSDGDCIPYVNERKDGLTLQDWVRQQPFYNGEIYLCGGSYTATVHYLTAPFASDIKGAVLNKQDCDRYNIVYRNGCYKMGYWNWFAGRYKNKTDLPRNCQPETYHVLPFTDFTKTVFGERVPSFDEKLFHPDKKDVFWETEEGGAPARNAVQHANIPVLLTVGFYDLTTGGVFTMWKEMDEQTKAQSALIVHPYDHGGFADYQPVKFENGSIAEQFGDYQVRWLNAIRGGEKPFVEQGKVTYYQSFGDGWRTDDFAQPENKIEFTLGNEKKTYAYNPCDPTPFNGGLSMNWGGTAWQDKPNVRNDVISVYTAPFEKDTVIKGKMQAKLRVKSSCEDTCFYVRVSLAKADGDYGLRDDIQQLSNFYTDYSGEEIDLPFSFDEHAFTVKKGEKLRVDISSSAFPLFVRHTNNKGLFSIQSTTKIAQNTVDLKNSTLTIYVEE